MMLHPEQTGPFSECKMAVSQNRDLTRFVCNICFYGIYRGRKKQAKPPNSRRKKQNKAKVIRTTQTEEKEQAVIQEVLEMFLCLLYHFWLSHAFPYNPVETCINKTLTTETKTVVLEVLVVVLV